MNRKVLNKLLMLGILLILGGLSVFGIIIYKTKKN